LRLYEGMFILNETRCTEDYNGTVGTVHDILKEFGAEIVDSRKWDDRRLAYPIRGQSRGIYVLVHFNAEPRSIAAIERRLHLAGDIVLRDLITIDEDGVNMGREREREAQLEAERRAEQQAKRESEQQAEAAAQQTAGTPDQETQEGASEKVEEAAAEKEPEAGEQPGEAG